MVGCQSLLAGCQQGRGGAAVLELDTSALGKETCIDNPLLPDDRDRTSVTAEGSCAFRSFEREQNEHQPQDRT